MFGLIAALLLFLLLITPFLLLVALWLWLLVGTLKSGSRKKIGFLALNLTTPFIVLEGLRYGMAGTLLAPLALPLVAMFEVTQVQKFRAFIFPVLSEALIFGVVVLLITLAVRHSRKWCIGAGLVTLIAASTVIAEKHSQEQMCAAAGKLGITAFSRNTFLWSLRNTPREFQMEFHALAEKDGKTLGWSYKELAFFETSENVQAGVEASVFRCV